MKLIPGVFDDDISLAIFHAPLPSTKASTLSNPPRPSTKDLEKTVPKGWEVTQSRNSRYMFIHDDRPFWTHPDPSFDRTVYEPPLEERSSADQVHYEALSYVWDLLAIDMALCDDKGSTMMTGARTLKIKPALY